MSYQKFDQQFFEPFSKMMDEIFPKDIQDWMNKKFSNFGIYIPAANIVENAENFELEMTAPGRKKSEFSIQFSDGRLSIRTEKKELPELKEDASYVRKEFAYPAIRRNFYFPKGEVETGKVKASYKNGILRVNLPKKKASNYESSTTINVD